VSRGRFHLSRIVRAFLVAPLAVPPVYWLEMLVETVVADPTRRTGLDDALRELAVVIVFASPVAYVATTVVGLPAYLLLHGTRAFRGAVMAGLGAVAGAVVALALKPHLGGDPFRVRLGPWRGALVGAAAAAVFWYLSRDSTRVEPPR
jgi:ABC-type molybdate transport system permease subunit